MEWQKSEIGDIWHWSDSGVNNAPWKAVIHCNSRTSLYGAAILGLHHGGSGVSAQGISSLEEAKEWVRLILGK